MEKEPIKFGLGVEMWIYDGPGGQGEKWKPLEIPKEGLELAYLVFDLMMEGRSIQLVRREVNGILYAVTIPGKDREMPFYEYVKQYRPKPLPT